MSPIESTATRTGGRGDTATGYVVQFDDGDSDRQFVVTSNGLLVGRESEAAKEPPDIALRCPPQPTAFW